MPRELENIVEAIIFASPEGASTKEITRCVRGAVATAREADGEQADEGITRFAEAGEDQVTSAIAHLNAIYEETGRAFRLVERPAGWRIMSRAEYAPWVRELFPDKKPARLTPSALETLAIIAYRQPITKSSIEAVRGVSVDGPVSALLDRNVIRIAGRADLPGRPLLYETTDVFLEHFGIRTVDELPNASELRSVKLPEPEPIVPPSPSPQTELRLDSNGEPAESGTDAGPSAPKSKGKSRGKGKSAAVPPPESPEPPVTDSPGGSPIVLAEATEGPPDVPVLPDSPYPLPSGSPGFMAATEPEEDSTAITEDVPGFLEGPGAAEESPETLSPHTTPPPEPSAWSVSQDFPEPDAEWSPPDEPLDADAAENSGFTGEEDDGADGTSGKI